MKGKGKTKEIIPDDETNNGNVECPCRVNKFEYIWEKDVEEEIAMSYI